MNDSDIFMLPGFMNKDIVLCLYESALSRIALKNNRFETGRAFADYWLFWRQGIHEDALFVPISLRALMRVCAICVKLMRWPGALAS